MNVLIVGVGGQGTLLASRILGNLEVLKGLDCKLNEVHGMAQRGGSVVTHVKMSDKVYSPVIAEGDADFILAFEPLEALRYRRYLKKGGVIIMNLTEIPPMSVIIGTSEYPKNIEAELKTHCTVVAFDALAAAEKAGNARAVNTAVLGRFARVAGIPVLEIEKALEMSVKPKLLEINKKAVKMGYEG